MTDQDLADEIIGRYRDALDRGEAVDPEQVHPAASGAGRASCAIDSPRCVCSTGPSRARVQEPDADTGTARPTRTAAAAPTCCARELGSGGMGTVYLRARPCAPRRRCRGHRGRAEGRPPAPPREARLPGAVPPEVAAGRRVRHGNVVPTYDMGEAQVDGVSILYMSMAYVEGLTLRDLLLRPGTGSGGDSCARSCRQVADGLAAIHAAGIVHRDLKPENILVTADHEVRITDLGVARLMEASQRLTSVGQFAGSVLYAAPEQFRGDNVGAAADLYAVGVVSYELLTGENPFRHDRVDGRDARSPGDAATLAHRHGGRRLALPLRRDDAACWPRTRDAASPRRRALCETLTEGESSAWWADYEKADRRPPATRPADPGADASRGSTDGARPWPGCAVRGMRRARDAAAPARRR